MPSSDEPIVVELVDRVDSALTVKETESTSSSVAEPDMAPEVDIAQAALQPPMTDRPENRNAESGQPREHALKALAKLKRMLATLSVPAVIGPQMIPPLPRPALRLDRATMITSATASASIAQLSHSRASAQRQARGIALVIYKQRVRTRIQRNLPIGSPAPGRMLIGLRLSRSGRLLSALVLRSSGNPFIDRAALHCVRAAGPYPVPPPGIGPAQLALAIAFRFQ